MSLIKSVGIQCDAEGCLWWEGESSCAKDARVFTQLRGWTRKNGKDYCRGCSRKLGLVCTP